MRILGGGSPKAIKQGGMPKKVGAWEKRGEWCF